MAEKVSELLHATMEIDADGTVREAGASRNFGASHAFDEAKDERFAIRIGQGTDGLEDLVGFGLSRAGRGMGTFLVAVGLLVKFFGRLRMAMKIVGAIAGDGCQPASESRHVAERVEAGKGLQENVLDEIFDGRMRDS